MSLPASDAFTGSNGTALAVYNSSWTVQCGGFTINSNSVAAGAIGAESGAFWNADSFSADQYSQGKITASTGTTAMGVAVRVNTSTTDSYYGFYGGNAASYLFKMVSGTWTQIGSNGAVFAANDVVRLEVSGTTLTPKVNGSTSGIGARTDSSLSSGAAGLSAYASGNGRLLDDWEGGNLGVSPVSVALNALSLASSIQALSVSPGAVSVVLDGLTAASSMPAGSIAATVSILLDALSAASSMPALSVSPGAVSVLVQTLTAASSLADLTVSPGAVSVLLDALSAASSLPAAQISAAVSVLMDALTAASSLPAASISPGAVSLLLDALALASSLPASAIAAESGPQAVALDGLSLAGSMPAAQISAAVSVLLNALTTLSSMPQASLTPGAVSVLVQALTLAGSLQEVQISATVAVVLQALTAQSSVSALEIQSSVAVLVQALTLQSQALDLEASTSGGVVDLEVIQLVAALSALVYQKRSSELMHRRGRFTPG